MKTKHFIFILLLSFYAGLLVLQKINLTTADLGRHLKNGQLFLTSHYILKTNTYSYTHSNFPVITHHWGAGVIFYLLFLLGGFKLLTITYGLLIAGTTSLGLYLAIKLNKNLWATLLVFIFTIPLLTYRVEVRPEGFSYFFLSLEIVLIYLYFQRSISFRRLIISFLLTQLLWVNLHLFFVLGIMISGTAFVSSFLLEKWTKRSYSLFLLTLSTIGVSFFNPFSWRGVIEPFLIFRNYGYMIVENQSLFFALHRLPSYVFLHTLFIIGLSFIIFFLNRHLISKMKPEELFLSFLIFVFSSLALRYIRAIPLLGFVLLPWLSFQLTQLTVNYRIDVSLFQIIDLSLIVIIFWSIFATSSPYSPFHLHRFGIGLMPGVNQAANFFKEQHLRGPIFNNYDIGGYLIYHLYPQERVFVDNRPEAYPASFFQKVYIPAQQSEQIWRQKETKYNFQVIFFYRHDATPWGQPFLIRRLKDPQWIPVYVDNYSLILVKNNKINQTIIKKYRLPDKIFQITPS